MTKVSKIVGLSIAVASLAALASCSASEPFGDVPQAALPSSVGSDWEAPVKDSLRLLGEDSSGVSYYVGRWGESQAEKFCLVIVKTNDFSRSCSETLPITGELTGTRATLSSGDVASPTPDGSELVGKYLVVARV
ncbi:hypothetical protein J2Y69_000673 [Microbacterium resistens]|uniref:Lipoprotein n=1 Tax=Microbacterium resistens TaxID=156977 RepID=A0ABU1SA00_9MICO|nr:hypothetical protein [Microbacterium resistens]MDR6866088.1 hypothetical protein [Microbacterium resistens]